MNWPHWLAHAWHLVKRTHHNRYFECRTCGARKVQRGFPGFQPVNDHWLAGGSWDNPNKVPLAPPGTDPKLTVDLRGWSAYGGGGRLSIDPDEDGDVNDPGRPKYRSR